MKKKHRLKSIILGLFIMAIILITGTFAFQLFNQSAFNPARVEAVDYLEGGRIHDDFEYRGLDDPQYGDRDKDIYAENFGETDLMVRVQFREFLSLNGNAIGGTSVGPAVINNPATWPVAMFTNPTTRQAGSYSAEIGDAGVEWTLGNAAGVQKVFMPTHNQVSRPNLPVAPIVPAPFNTPYAYQFSDTTGSAVEAIAGFDISSVTNVEEIIARGIQTGPQISNGTHGFWTVGQTYTSNLIFIDEDEITAEADITHYAQPTLTATDGGIMLLADFIAADRPAGNFWIMDPGSGWFYWNGYLLGSNSREALAEAGNTDPLLALPTTATSLLLNGVHIPRHQDLEYVIQINADWFTTETIGNLMPLPSEDLFPPVTLSNASVTINDENLVVTTTIGGTATGAIIADPSALPASINVSVSGNVITVTGVRPATGEPAIAGTFTVPVTRGGETVNLSVVVDLTPGISLPNPVTTGQGCTEETIWTDSTGVVWCILVPANDPRGGIGYTLMITRNTVVNSTHADIITATDTWFNNATNVSLELRAVSMNTQVPPARGTSTVASSGENTFMLPQPGVGRAFSLSEVEANAYFANNAARAATGTDTDWWLRSLLDDNIGHLVSDIDGINTFNGSLSLGVRPAIWVSID